MKRVKIRKSIQCLPPLGLLAWFLFPLHAATLRWIPSGTGNWREGDYWSTGNIPAVGDRIEITNGGTARIHEGDGVNLALDDMLLTGGGLDMASGKFTGLGYQVIGGTLGTSDGSFSLKMAGDSSLSCAALFLANGRDSSVTINMSGNSMLRSREWLVFGRQSGKATIAMSGRAVIETTSSDAGQYSPLGEDAGAEVLIEMRDFSSIRSTVPLMVGRGECTTEITLHDQASLQSNTRLDFGNVAATSRLFMEGGQLIAPRLVRDSNDSKVQINIDGGTIIAMADEPDYFQYSTATPAPAYAHLGPRGMIFDTNEHEVGIKAVFEGPGGLIKRGEGVLTLEGDQSFLGDYAIEEGTLALVTGGTLRGNLHVLTGATLEVAGESYTWVEVQQNMELEDGAGILFRTEDLESGTVLNIWEDLIIHGRVTFHIRTDHPVEPGSYALLQHENPIRMDGALVDAIELDAPGMTASLSDDGFFLWLDITGVKGPQTYEEWEFEHRLDDDQRGPENDPDGDGISNLQEWYFGGNPLVPDRSVLPAMTRGDEFVDISFQRSLDAADALSVQTLQNSFDLALWGDYMSLPEASTNPDGLGLFVVVTDNGDRTQNVIIRVPNYILQVLPDLFLRIRLAM